MATRSVSRNLEIGTNLEEIGENSDQDKVETEASQKGKGISEISEAKNESQAKSKEISDSWQSGNGSRQEAMEELSFVKAQLENLQLQFHSLGVQTTPRKTPIETEQCTSGQEDLSNMENFPTLGTAQEPEEGTHSKQSSPLPSWRDKVSKPNSPIGMPLKYVPPIV
ncbi:unnamed protein product [Amaranthus hypochondriacus]